MTGRVIHRPKLTLLLRVPAVQEEEEEREAGRAKDGREAVAVGGGGEGGGGREAAHKGKEALEDGKDGKRGAATSRSSRGVHPSPSPSCCQQRYYYCDALPAILVAIQLSASYLMEFGGVAAALPGLNEHGFKLQLLLPTFSFATSVQLSWIDNMHSSKHRHIICTHSSMWCFFFFLFYQ